MTDPTPEQVAAAKPLPTSYTDAMGRYWSTVVDLPTSDRLENELGFNIDTLLSGEGPRAIATQPRKAFKLLWCIVGPQAQASDVTEPEWLAGLGLRAPDAAEPSAEDQAKADECAANALDALVGGLIAFFPQREVRAFQTAVYRTLPETAQTMATAIVQVATTGNQLLHQTAESAGSSPDSSASTLPG